MPADGALVNSSYSAFAAGMLNAISNENDWLHVTIYGVAAGPHTLTAPNHPTGLTDWTLNGNITTAGIVIPPPPPGNGVPDSGSSALLLGLSCLGLARFAQRSKK